MLYIFKPSAFNRIALFLLFILFVSMTFTETVSAKEFDLGKYNDYTEYVNNTGNFNDSKLLKDIEEGSQSLLAMVVDAGFNILALFFVMGIIAFAAGTTMRNGQWSKWSSGIMTGTFMAIILLRISPILVLTIDKTGITIVLSHIVELLSSLGYYMAIIMFLIGLFLRSLNKIFEHPKYFRWGRTLLSGCVIIMILSYISPIVITSL